MKFTPLNHDLYTFKPKRAAPTCVHFDVLVKRVPLRKGSEANFTFEGLGSGVGPVVVLQVLLGGEALPARLTHEGPFPCKEQEN